MITLWIGLGGAVGAVVRYHLDGWIQRRLGTSFPYGTLAVNALGSFLIAVVMHVGVRTEMLSPTARIALTTGVLGGFTTYSTFNHETLGYFQQGAWGIGVLNVAAMLAACLACGVAGLWTGRYLVGA